MKLKLQKFEVILVVITCFLYAGLAYAGIGVKPTITEITVPAARATKGILVVVNSDEETLHVTVEPEDWLKKRTGKDSIPVGDWLTIESMEFDIEPEEVKRIGYTISPPAGYEGELIAMIFFAASVPMEGAFGITSRFGVSIYAAIEETIILACNIDNIAAKKDQKGIIFSMDLENQGNVHLRPAGNILILAEDGTEYNVLIKRGFPVYPGSELNYSIRWNKIDVPPGRYEATMKVDVGKLHNRDKILERKVSFVVGEDGEISY